MAKLTPSVHGGRHFFRQQDHHSPLDCSPRHRKDFLGPGFDIWTEIRRIRHLNPLKIKCKWVHSHQESERDFDPTLPEVRLNIDVDKMAGDLSSTRTQNPPTLLIPSSSAAIIVSGRRYHHFPAQIIRDQCHGPPLQEYIKKKTGWSLEQFQSIDWDAYSRTLSSLSPPVKVNWIKLAMNWQNTGSQNLLFQQADRQELCPMACGEVETPMHFCLCRSDLACGHKSVHLNTLSTHLVRANTSPSLRRAMIEVIASYCFLPITHPFQPSFASARARRIVSAIKEIKSLGVDNLLKGRVSLAMGKCQLEYFQSLPPNSKIHPEQVLVRWKRKVIHALVTFTLAIWNDRNAVLHGTPLQNSHLELIAHVHQAVKSEYSQHERSYDSFMAPHFATSCAARLKTSLRSMRLWLKRVEASKQRQRLRLEALAKIRDLQSQRHFVDSDGVLTLPNVALARWIRTSFTPSSDRQTTLDMFMSP